MAGQRQRLEPSLWGKVARPAVHGDETTAQLAAKLAVPGNRASTWKKQRMQHAAKLFETGRWRHQQVQADEEELVEQIERLQMQLAWLKKNCRHFQELGRCIQPDYLSLSVARQCKLLGLRCSTCTFNRDIKGAQALDLEQVIEKNYPAAHRKLPPMSSYNNDRAAIEALERHQIAARQVNVRLQASFQEMAE